jgi:hypothetical protein
LAGQAWLLRGASLALFMVVCGLPYNTDFVEVAQIQVLALALLGTIIATGRGLPQRAAAGVAHGA